MRIFRGKTNETLFLVVDIGSASVGAALALSRRDDVPKVIYDTRAFMPFSEELTLRRYRSDMLKALRAALDDLRKNGLPHLKFTSLGSLSPRYAYCSLSSPWYVSQTRMVTRREQIPVRVTRAYIEKIVNEEKKHFLAEEAHKRFPKSDPYVFEESAMRITLEGYPVARPEGKRARDVSVTSVFSAAARRTLARVAEEIHSFGGVETLLASFPVTSLRAVRAVSGKEGALSALLLDVGGEVTDVSLVRGGIIASNASFPVGYRTIVRGLAHDLKTSIAEARSLLRAEHEGAVSHMHKGRVGKAIGKREEEWVRGFSSALTRIASSFSVPRSVFFATDPEIAPLVRSLVAKEEFAQFSMAEEPFDAVAVNAAFLGDVCSFGKYSRRDPFLAAGVVAAETVFGDGAGENMIK